MPIIGKIANLITNKNHPSRLSRLDHFFNCKLTNPNKGRHPPYLFTGELTLISEMGIPVVDYSPEDAESEADFAEKWIQDHKV